MCFTMVFSVHCMIHVCQAYVSPLHLQFDLSWIIVTGVKTKQANRHWFNYFVLEGVHH